MNEKQTPAQSTHTVRPTKKQRDILTFIEQFIAEHGYSPSYREIMSGLNYTSVATVSLHVNSLIRRGHLAKRDRSARSLEVITPTAASSAAPRPQPSAANQSTDATTRPAEEIWLNGKIDSFIMGLTTAELSPENVLKLEIVHEATKLLGLHELAEETGNKIVALQARLSADQDTPTLTT